MMDFELENAVAILGRTPELLKTWLQDLPEPWVYNNDGEGTWSAFDVVGHLIQGDRADWIPRMQLILSAGGEKEFEPLIDLHNSKQAGANQLPICFPHLRNFAKQTSLY